MADVVVVKVIEAGPQGAPAPDDILAQIQGLLDNAVAAATAERVLAQTARLEAQAIKTALEAPGGVGTTRLADKSVTRAKMADLATGTILGRTSAGTGGVEALAAPALTSFIVLALATAGNVGVGVGSPTDKLHVGGAIRSTGDLKVAGSIAVGTTSITDAVHVTRASGNCIVRSSTTDAAAYARVALASVAREWNLTSVSSGELVITDQTAGTQRLTLVSAGPAYVNSNLHPSTDNARSLGGGSNRWSAVYAATGSINTSDAREKTPVRALLAAEMAAAHALASEVGVFQFLASIEEKGEEAARLHVGMTVQRAVEIMEDHGLDPWRYGFICKDQITRKVKVTRTVTEQVTGEVDEAYAEIEIRDGVPVQVPKTRRVQRPRVEMVAVVDEAGMPVMQDGEPLLHPVPVMVDIEREVEIEEPAGDRLGFRYDQLTLFILRGLLARLDKVETA